MADRSNSIPASDDNCSPMVRLADDIANLARMASINFQMIERDLSLGRLGVRTDEDGNHKFTFSDEAVEEMTFTAMECWHRSRSVADRVRQLVDVGAWPDGIIALEGAPAAGADRAIRDLFTPISDIEGALALISGLTEAVEELASMKDNPARRLSAINAVTGPLQDEVKNAKEAVRELYDRRSEMLGLGKNAA